MPDTPADRVVFDELHVTLLVHRALSDTAVERAHRVIGGRRFVAQVRRAVAAVLSQHLPRGRVTVVVTR
ncbi:hypothetical protein [Fimbriiglobus ruber]|uniref:Uncharacterized protein n=1 Tax=Fimbriiglobus ruber TaxID=1908690 RepID=A0A225D151_9BACT|nr:hypothetical protein [Fimbriiglobus ruber]OWK35242.1 hypothetical protein FRUB_09403 [Fimbriiglobus ruber]